MSDKFWTDEVAEFTYPLPKAPAGDPLYGAALRGGGVTSTWALEDAEVSQRSRSRKYRERDLWLESYIRTAEVRLGRALTEEERAVVMARRKQWTETAVDTLRRSLFVDPK